MKILHTMAGGAAGGAEMAYVDLLVAQRQAGLDVIAVCRPNTQRNQLLRNAGVSLYELPFGGILDFRTKRNLKKIIELEKPEIVQCWMSRAAKLTPKIKGIPKIARLGGYYNLKYYKDVDHFIGNTPDICRWLIEDQKVTPEKVSYINNFAELEAIDKPLKKADFNTKQTDFVFLSMARLHPVKGLDIALQALASVPNALLWIAGNGPEEKKLKKLADDLNVADRVRWLGWRTDRSALLDICDAVLFPSRFEPFGGTFAQAWAARKPLITTASQGPMQYVTDGIDALVAPIDAVGIVAQKMKLVMDDKNLVRSLTRAGYKKYLELFTISNVIKSYDKLYNKLKN